jgi:hypothetical protein
MVLYLFSSLDFGTESLDGKEYFKLSAKIPILTWDRIKHSFGYFGTSGNFSGWLTCEPSVVEFALNIKENPTTDSAVCAAL